MSKWSYTACPPLCKCCPEIKIVEDDEGKNNVVISDDYNGVVYMSIHEFRLMADNFLRAYHMGDIHEYN